MNACECLKKWAKEELDEVLWKWMRMQHSADLIVSWPLLKIQAKNLQNNLVILDLNVHMYGLINIHGITSWKIYGEAKSANKVKIATWVSKK